MTIRSAPLLVARPKRQTGEAILCAHSRSHPRGRDFSPISASGDDRSHDDGSKPRPCESIRHHGSAAAESDSGRSAATSVSCWGRCRRAYTLLSDCSFPPHAL